MATVLITGGTGLIGSVLARRLCAKGYAVIILTRSMPEEPLGIQGVSYAIWDVEAGRIDSSAVAKADHIIHLAGANVAEKRWTRARKQLILESRTKSSALVVKALQETGNKVQSVISGSAIGWYGADTPASLKQGFVETDPADEAFLGTTCDAWEQSIRPVEQLGKRLVLIRTGIVLSGEGGAYAEFVKPIRFGIAAILGGGSQVISWIHIEDICRMFIYALENNLSGVYNGVAPAPVTNKALTLMIAKAIRKSFFIPIHVPVFILKLVLGEMSIEVLKSATVNADKIRIAGFQFLFPSAEAAVHNLTRPSEDTGAF